MSLGEGGSSSSVGLIVATVFVAAGILAAQTAMTRADGRDPNTAASTAQAQLALARIVGEAGHAASGDWASDPDAMARFGLAREDRAQFLDYAKVRALRNGSADERSSTNDAPDYLEVKEALGIRSGDFHIRSYPVLMGVDDARWTADTNLKVAYFGHYGGATAPATITTAVSATTTVINASVTIKNEAAKDATFTATISLGNAASEDDIITEERHTRLLRPGETQTLSALFHSVTGWDTDIDAVHIAVTDPYSNPAVDTSGVDISETWVTGVTRPTSSASSYNLLNHASDVYYTSGSTVEFILDHYTGTGDHVNGAQGRFTLSGPNGNEWVNTTISLPKQPNTVYTYSCANCTQVGNYTAKFWNMAMTRVHVDSTHVAAATMFDEKASLDPIAITESNLLKDLVADFDATRFDSTTNPGGDLFGDDINQARDLADQLSQYTTLVVGSEVSQTALNSANVKYAIRDWVQLEGGNLVVLGTVNQQSRWLEPVYHAAQETAGGGISAPDATHPILSAPETIQYEKYLDNGRAWRIKEGSEFTHVLSRGTSNNAYDDTLAVSTPGSFNDGSVVLTSYMPGRLTSPQDNDEAKRFLHNLLSQGHAMLFIDYGPPIPDGTAVASASRLAVVTHPNIPDVEVEIRLVIYLFN